MDFQTKEVKVVPDPRHFCLGLGGLVLKITRAAPGWYVNLRRAYPTRLRFRLFLLLEPGARAGFRGRVDRRPPGHNGRLSPSPRVRTGFVFQLVEARRGQFEILVAKGFGERRCIGRVAVIRLAVSDADRLGEGGCLSGIHIFGPRGVDRSLVSFFRL